MMLGKPRPKGLVINGAMGAGRHYLIAVLSRIYSGHDFVKVIDGYPRVGTGIQPGAIHSNHMARRPAPMHYDFEAYRQLIEKGEAGFIFLYRDPRDMLASILRHHKYQTKGQAAYEAAHRLFAQDETDQDSLVRLILNGDQVNFMKYAEFADDLRYFFNYEHSYLLSFEELVFSPYRSVRNLLLTFGYPVNSSRVAEAVAEVYRTGRVGGWRATFDKNVVNQFKRAAGDLVSHMEYEVDESWSLDVVRGDAEANADQDLRLQLIRWMFLFFMDYEPVETEIEEVNVRFQGASIDVVRTWFLRESGRLMAPARKP